ncbi:MAG TPA: SulP family inorganic anion transporter, partial [Saprospiraceae bacterium]|nr:SulP family inorganic anion transporter [Saprospiraceae bacterium]
LPLCLGIALASGASAYSGLIAGIIGGIVVSSISNSQLSVSGPAAGLTAICAASIAQSPTIQAFFCAVALAGIFQILLGVFKLGGFTHFIPSNVIKGMLAAIGILLISKQFPILIGYNEADFWSKELINVFNFSHGFENIHDLYEKLSVGVILITVCSIAIFVFINPLLKKYLSYIPSSILMVVIGMILPIIFERFIPSFSLHANQYVSLPANILSKIQILDFTPSIINTTILKTALVICLVATLETLLSIEAIDKLDPYNRITNQNKELIAQGSGNFFSGLLGGLPITAVIVRSSANAEAGGRTRLSAIFHGIWILLAIAFASQLINKIPYCVLSVILLRTGFNLAKPKMIKSVYKQGREQFIPFLVTVIAILFTDLLMGVFIGIFYAGYFILKNTYKAGYTLFRHQEGGKEHYIFSLAINVSFLNKKRLKDELETLPDHSIVVIDANNSIYIDYDVIEVLNEFKSKAVHKKIDLTLLGIPDVEIFNAH